MAGARIGGNVADIVGAAGVITDTGTAAVDAGAEASGFAAEMEGEVSDVTQVLSQHFVDMSEVLRTAIKAAKDRLAATDWEGSSQAAATETETALNGEVDGVLTNALDSVEEFRTFMMARATDFVSMVEGDFNTIMANIDTAYAELGTASETFAENLQLADETIKFTG